MKQGIYLPSFKDLAVKFDVKYWVILQYETGNRRIRIERLYAITEALSISITDLIPILKSCLKDDRKELLNLGRQYEKITDQKLRKMFCLLTNFVQVSEKKAEKIKIAKGFI